MAQTEAAGTQIYISNASNEVAASAGAFAALTWLEIGEITNIGEFGKQYQDIATKTLNQRLTKHHKGSYDVGTLDLQVYADPSDTGQDKAEEALGSDYEYAFKITLNDGSAGSPSSPTTYYFRGKVMSYRRTISDVDSMVTARVGIAINTDLTEVAAV